MKASKPKRPAATRFKTYPAKRAGAQFERMLADVAAGCVVEITVKGEAVASMLSTTTLETLEILANPAALKAIRAAESGKLKFRDWAEVEAELEAKRGKKSFSK